MLRRLAGVDGVDVFRRDQRQRQADRVEVVQHQHLAAPAQRGAQRVAVERPPARAEHRGQKHGGQPPPAGAAGAAALG
eukprot:SAG22_NODE_6513_length_845_cov_0.904826_2_plen_77_part_01